MRRVEQTVVFGRRSVEWRHNLKVGLGISNRRPSVVINSLNLLDFDTPFRGRMVDPSESEVPQDTEAVQA